MGDTTRPQAGRNKIRAVRPHRVPPASLGLHLLCGRVGACRRRAPADSTSASRRVERPGDRSAGGATAAGRCGGAAAAVKPAQTMRATATMKAPPAVSCTSARDERGSQYVRVVWRGQANSTGTGLGARRTSADRCVGAKIRRLGDHVVDGRAAAQAAAVQYGRWWIGCPTRCEQSASRRAKGWPGCIARRSVVVRRRRAHRTCRPDARGIEKAKHSAKRPLREAPAHHC